MNRELLTMSKEQRIMNKEKRASSLFSFFFAGSLFAVDVGLVLDQNAEYAGSGDDTVFTYKGIAIPRVTGLVGDAGDFYISAGFSYKNNPWGFVPEILRTDFNWRSVDMELNIGRMEYDDLISYIASSLFDGARYSQNTDVSQSQKVDRNGMNCSACGVSFSTKLFSQPCRLSSAITILASSLVFTLRQTSFKDKSCTLTASCFCGMPSRSHWKATFMASSSVFFLVDIGGSCFPFTSLKATE
jgi:hypothetical protein